ncbi:MAG: type IV pilus twitching motility protein PilT [Elusimicrobia bacterium]|nr:type IV pilus twitching motility protein PilT [Elusimicrobiota bacterium]
MTSQEAQREMTLLEMVKVMAGKHASDLHLTVGASPMLRLDTKMIPFEGQEILTPEKTKDLAYQVLNPTQIARFEETNELDMSFGLRDVGRIRMNVYRQRGSVAAALRLIPSKVWTFEELNLPKVVYEIVDKPQGLVLVTGATGSGKSTTLASMINYINEKHNGHIITIEDPIEYVHNHKKCIVNQREIGSDSENFARALKHVLRQDPDVILIGEMRDLETISSAITLAETGHLVFATLHTMDAASSVNRILDVFPSHQQAQIRSQLSMTLQAVFSQQLLPHISGKGMVLVSEVMIANGAIRAIVREAKTEQLYITMQTSSTQGMQTMNQSIAENIAKGKISRGTGIEYSWNREELHRLLTARGVK